MKRQILSSTKMTQNEIPQLLEDLSGENNHNIPIGSQTPSWQAYRMVEKIDNDCLFEPISDYIKNKPSSIRNAGYGVLGYILKNTKSKDVAKYLFHQLSIEINEPKLLHQILRALNTEDLTYNVELQRNQLYLDSEHEMVRNQAIKLTQKVSFTPLIKSELVHVILDPYDENDFRLAVKALAATCPSELENLLPKMANTSKKEFLKNVLLTQI